MARPGSSLTSRQAWIRNGRGTRDRNRSPDLRVPDRLHRVLLGRAGITGGCLCGERRVRLPAEAGPGTRRVSCGAFSRGRQPVDGLAEVGLLTWNERVWISRRPVIVTVYVPAAIPVVWTVTMTVPLPSGPLTTSG
jgi:hypothetical protein